MVLHTEIFIHYGAKFRRRIFLRMFQAIPFAMISILLISILYQSIKYISSISFQYLHINYIINFMKCFFKASSLGYIQGSQLLSCIIQYSNSFYESCRNLLHMVLLKIFILFSYFDIHIFHKIHCHYCFSIGEAAIISQGLVIFLSNSYIKLIAIVNKTNYCLGDDRTFLWTIERKNTCEMEQLTTILQVGLYLNKYH